MSRQRPKRQKVRGSATLNTSPLTVLALLRAFRRRISLTWLLIFIEVALTALVPLFIGFAIDGLLTNVMGALFQLIALLAVLILVSVIRRAYDTRIFGTVRVEMGKAQAARATNLSISTLNAQLGMGRELVNFLETDLPLAMTSVVQLIISVVVLYAFDPMLAWASVSAVAAMLAIPGKPAAGQSGDTRARCHSGACRRYGRLAHAGENRARLRRGLAVRLW